MSQFGLIVIFVGKFPAKKARISVELSMGADAPLGVITLLELSYSLILSLYIFLYIPSSLACFSFSRYIFLYLFLSSLMSLEWQIRTGVKYWLSFRKVMGSIPRQPLPTIPDSLLHCALISHLECLFLNVFLTYDTHSLLFVFSHFLEIYPIH